MINLNHLCFNCFKDKGDFEVCPHCGYVTGTGTEQTYYLAPGTILAGRYIIGNAVGLGGFGITYKAFDAKLDMVVAIKEFYPSSMVNRAKGTTQIEFFTESQQTDYRRMLNRFAVEAKNLAVFSKEQDIVAVYDYFEENKTGYIVMEFMEGILLKRYLKDYGSIPLEDAIPIILQVLQAASKIHEKGIVHRDISPDNIYLGENNVVKLFDFGAASFQDNRDLERDTIIKAGYTPPEQYRKNIIPNATMDIYSIGALFYEMLTGERPLEATDRMLNDSLQSPQELGAEIPQNVNNAIMKSLSLDPEQRFQSANEFYETIAEAKTVKLPDPRSGRNGRMWKWIGGIVCATAVVTVGVVFTLYKTNILNYVPKEDTTLEVWLAVDDKLTNSKSEDDKKEIQDIQNNLSSTFEEKYEGVKVEITAIPEGEYAKKLADTPEAELPDVFCADYASEKKPIAKEDLSKIAKNLDNVAYLFTDEYETLYPDKTEIPTGFQMAVYYKNVSQEALQADEEKIDIASVKGQDSKGTCQWLDTAVENKDQLKLLRNLKKDPSALAGSLSAWNEVQNATVSSGKSVELQIIPITEDEKLLCSFNNSYAVKATEDKNQKKTAMLFLYHMLGNASQRELWMKQDDALPINARAYKDYMDNLKQYQVQYINDNIIVSDGNKVDISISANVKMDGTSTGVLEAYGK